MKFPQCVFIGLGLVLAFLSGCQAPPQLSSRTYSPTGDSNSNSAVVYIIRPAHQIGSATSPYVLIDGAPVVDLPNSSYFRAVVSPGSRVISTEVKYIGQKKWSDPATFRFEAGKVYYLKFYPDGPGGTAMIYGAGGAFYSAPDATRVKHPFTIITKEEAESLLVGMREAEPIEKTKPKK